ncbi:hypothetical protein HDU93_006815 [Gonapodya sp. JEL0774]|nr:hypothetical protein HDU93_006815 [Gonapodya sp. JEL0774]
MTSFRPTLLLNVHVLAGLIDQVSVNRPPALAKLPNSLPHGINHPTHAQGALSLITGKKCNRFPSCSYSHLDPSSLTPDQITAIGEQFVNHLKQSDDSARASSSTGTNVASHIQSPHKRPRTDGDHAPRNSGSSSESAITNILSNLITDQSHQATNMGGQLVNLEHHISTIASSVDPIAVTLPNLTTKQDALNNVLHKLVLRLDTLEANLVTLGVEENPKDTDVVMQRGSNRK